MKFTAIYTVHDVYLMSKDCFIKIYRKPAIHIFGKENELQLVWSEEENDDCAPPSKLMTEPISYFFIDKDTPNGDKVLGVILAEDEDDENGFIFHT